MISRGAIGVVLALFGAGCNSCELHDKVSSYRSAIERRAAEPDAQFSKAMAAISQGKWDDVSEQPACRQQVRFRGDEWVFSDVSDEHPEGWVDTAGLAVLPAAKLVALQQPGSLRAAAGLLDRLEQRGSPYQLLDDQAALDKAAELGDPDRWDFELLLAIDSASWPRWKGGEVFDSGELRGRAFLYSHREGRLVCAGEVDGSNEHFVKSSLPHSDRAKVLNIDLMINTVDGAIKGLKALPRLDD